MTSGCVLKRCRNSYAQVNKNSGISYHTFPSDPIMKHKWICIVQAERSENDWKPTTCSRICSEHFQEEDKYITFKGCIMRLKKSAVPAIPGMSISINSLNETQSTLSRPYSNAERQRRYRERKKADEMKACSTSSESSEQQQKQNDGDKNVDPCAVAHARNARKQHLNKLRQRRFRARQRFKSPSQQAQEFVTQEKYVDHDRHQDALENHHSSDPSHSTDSCLQTVLTTKRKIKESFDLLEGEDDDILNLHTHVEIKQEDFEDIESSVANLSSASCSQTNSACGSPTRESHIETFTEYEPQTTIDVTVLKEEPGSPLSDVSIHSDATDSHEDQEIKVKLRKKMKMLNENEEVLKRRCEEASILGKNMKSYSLISNTFRINSRKNASSLS